MTYVSVQVQSVTGKLQDMIRERQEELNVLETDIVQRTEQLNSETDNLI